MIAPPDYLSADDYLRLEADSDIKHEYIDGGAYAMAGVSDVHVTISLNLAVLLRVHTRGSGCRVYISDMKLRVEATNSFFYPDVMVTCDPRDGESRNHKGFPKVLVEVLSDSTEAFDRGDKFASYRTLETLEEYVLISTRHRRVEIFRRGEAGRWVLETYSDGKETFALESLGFTGTVAELYEDVSLEDLGERLPGDVPTDKDV